MGEVTDKPRSVTENLREIRKRPIEESETASVAVRALINSIEDGGKNT